jgi:hypothetical protein
MGQALYKSTPKTLVEEKELSEGKEREAVFGEVFRRRLVSL